MLKLYNTLRRSVEPVEPLRPGQVGMYSCGPTVYRFIHIGNLRTFTMADWIRRTLTYHGLEVVHVKNITDVGHMRQELLDRGEDKLVSQARKEGKTPWDIARFYTEAFLNDEAQLNILPAHIFPRATEHIPEMITMVEQLLEKGYAYRAGGNVFFSVSRFPGYGQLSGNRLEHLNLGTGNPVKLDERSRLRGTNGPVLGETNSELDPLKQAQEDFPLWKEAEEGRIMAWDSPWGRGFPGWHIECSAMSAKYLGTQFDIHTGGVDNIFPHHEDELAQSEGASGKQFVRYWVHAQHLLADGLKMAKSSGNAYTLADVEARGFEPLALRYFYTLALYRHRINFTFTALRSAQAALVRLREWAYRLHDTAGGAAATSAAALQEHPCHQAFLAAVDDDLNMPRAMAILWQMVRDQSAPPAERLALLYDFDRILGFDLAGSVAAHVQVRQNGATSGRKDLQPVGKGAGSAVPESVLATFQERESQRAAHNYAAADRLRAQLKAAGHAVQDTPTGGRIYPRPEGELYTSISSSKDVPSRLYEPDRYAFSVNLLAHNSRADLERCIQSVLRYADGQSLELLIVDNGSTDDTLTYLQEVSRKGLGTGINVQVLFADHDMGFAAARNASFRRSLGKIIIMLDTSIELQGDIWAPLEKLLADHTIGIAGPYGVVTEDLKEFQASNGPDVDAMEGYLMAFRRALLQQVGPADEKFRFYRLMDFDYSFEFKKAGYRVVVSGEVAAKVIKHPHREWYSLTSEEQATKSKKNYDIFRRRRHHCQSLLVANYTPDQEAPWGHTHEVQDPREVDPRFDHTHYNGEGMHTHEHKHWPDHAHTHPHTHTPAARWHIKRMPADTASTQ